MYKSLTTKQVMLIIGLSIWLIQVLFIDSGISIGMELTNIYFALLAGALIVYSIVSIVEGP